MEAKATARHIRMGPRKVRFVMDSIRGKYAQEALDILKFTPNHAADEIANVIKSAVANAETNHGMDGSYLKIARCFVDVGPTAKRVQPRAQGRAYRILKRTSHITVFVEEGTAPPTTNQRELDIKKRGPKPPLRAALKTPEVAPVNGTPTDETATQVTDVTNVSTDVETTPETTTTTATDGAE
jgi:large subunit ribosomal protein L22